MIDQTLQRRVVAASRLLDSDNPGERGAALNAVQRLLASQGKSIGDVLADGLKPSVLSIDHLDQPRATLLRPWQRKAWLLQASGIKWDVRSRDFLESMRCRRFAPTDKQLAYLDDLQAKAERNRRDA